MRTAPVATNLEPDERAEPHERAEPARARKHPWLLYITLLAIAGSGFSSLRISLGGLSVHPLLVPLGLLTFIELPRLGEISERLRWSLGVFLALFIMILVATPVPAGGPMASFSTTGEISKVLASAAMILTPGLAVRSTRDFRLAAVAMVVGVSIIGLRAFGGNDGVEGANPLEGIGNKNAFSLYALPAMMCAAYVLLDKDAPRWQRGVGLGGILLLTMASFQVANRSGWLGIVALGALLVVFMRRRSRAILIVAAVALFGFALVREYGNAAMLERRLTQTETGTVSDNYRLGLTQGAFELALENPIFGLGPRRLATSLAERLHARFRYLDPHNVFGYIAGGYGLTTLVALFALGWALWTTRAGPSTHPLGPDRLMRVLLVLWVIRGMFTREILYAPAFCAALGLALGLCRSSVLRSGEAT